MLHWIKPLLQKRKALPSVPSAPAPTLAPRPVPELSLPFLLEMDWLRFEALCVAHFRHGTTRATLMPLGIANGFDLRLYNSVDGARPDVLVRCNASSRTRLSAGRVTMFASGLFRQSIQKGIYVARAGFSADAIKIAAEAGITLVTPPRLLAHLQRLPSARQSELIHLTAVDQWDIPTCPKCLVKMLRRQKGDLLYWRCPNAVDCGQRHL